MYLHTRAFHGELLSKNATYLIVLKMLYFYNVKFFKLHELNKSVLRARIHTHTNVSVETLLLCAIVQQYY